MENYNADNVITSSKQLHYDNLTEKRIVRVQALIAPTRGPFDFFVVLGIISEKDIAVQ
jgi:hypothetical protein